jgi:hypothetical protein
MMDEKKLWQGLLEEMVRGWEILPTGSGCVVVSGWIWPTGDRIEVTVRNVGERDDLFLVSDGGELFSFFYAQGLDIAGNGELMHRLEEMVGRHGARLVDLHLARGAGESDLAEAVLSMVEAIKEGAFLFWMCREGAEPRH